MTNLRSLDSVDPGEMDAETVARAARRIKDYLAQHPHSPDPVEVKMEHGEPTLVLPRQTVAMFAKILTQLAEGQGITVLRSDAELTTQQAADILGVSRPFVIKLLETGEIPQRKVGRHRRVNLADLQAYQRRDDAERRQAADQLSALSQEMELY